MSEITYFKTLPIAKDVTFIQDLSTVFCYLVEGEKEAALIDTGTGIGNIAEFVKTLTDKPIKVLITHVHPDHSGGIFGFDDSQVYINEHDIPFLDGSDNCYEERKGYVEMMNGGVCPCPDEEIQRNRPMKVNALKDGDVFDLGGRTLEAIHVPGHTAGSTVYLDRVNRMIFLGDAANQNTLLSCASSMTVETYLNSLRHLKTFEDAYDNYFIAHGAPIAAKSTVDDLIELCEDVMAGKTEEATLVMEFNPYGDALRAKPINPKNFSRLDGKTGNLVFRPCKIFN